MRVQKIPVGDRNAYLPLDSEGVPVEAVAKYMKHLHNTEKSSNTLQTYCTALKYYFTYLEQIGLNFQEVSFEEISNFVGSEIRMGVIKLFRIKRQKLNEVKEQ